MNHANDFDKACRYLAKRSPRGLFGWLLPGHETLLTFEDWLDTRRLPFPGEPDRTCDTVARFRDTTDPSRVWLVVLEFQSRPERWMLLRLYQYLGLLLWEVRPRRGGRLPRVGGALVNLTGRPRRQRLGMTWPFRPDMYLHFGVAIRNLAEESAAQTLAQLAAGQVDRCILALVPLMQGGGESGIIQAWLPLAESEPDESLRADYAGLALVFAELDGCREAWRQALEGWNVQRSQQVLEWQQQARERAQMETKRADLLTLLRLRFGTEVPEGIAAAVAGQTDFAELSRWFELAATAESLDAFRAGVGIIPANGAAP